MEFGAEKRDGLVAVVLFSFYYIHDISVSSLPARFLSFVSFPRNVFFSFHISAALTLMLTIFQLVYCSHPAPSLSDLSPAVSPPTAIILIYLLTLFRFITNACTVATYSEVWILLFCEGHFRAHHNLSSFYLPHFPSTFPSQCFALGK